MIGEYKVVNNEMFSKNFSGRFDIRVCQIANEICEEGREEGLEQGELLKAKDMAYNLARLGVSIDKIAEAAKVSIQIIKQWLDSSGMSIA
jgi:transposase-like protein